MSASTSQLQFKTAWNDPAQCWIVSLYDDNGNAIIEGMAMVTGANLLEQFAYLGLGFQLVVQSDNDPDEVPSYTTLGTTGHLYCPSP